MKVTIQTIPHKEQRYPTVGDWYFEGSDLHIKVSQLDDTRYELLVAIHELIEVVLCQSDGVSQADVDAFDKEFERQREKGELSDPNAEPGDSPLAPYQEQHCFATGVERLMAARLGVVWDKYADKIESLP